jgi:hypothetical protein
MCLAPLPLDLPDADAARIADGHVQTGRAAGDTAHFIPVGQRQAFAFLAGGGVPEQDGVRHADRGQRLAVPGKTEQDLGVVRTAHQPMPLLAAGIQQQDLIGGLAHGIEIAVGGASERGDHAVGPPGAG